MSSDDEALGIKEAAASAGVSTKTICQWIKSGKLAATKGSTPYGDAYQIDPGDLNAIWKVLTAVTVERQPDPRAVALAVAEVVQERTADLPGGRGREGRPCGRRQRRGGGPRQPGRSSHPRPFTRRVHKERDSQPR